MAYTLKQLTMAWTAVHGGIAPDAETQAQLQLRTNASFSDQDALAYVLNSADNSTALAALSYQFFTGKSPTEAGMAYLTNSATNPNDLNDAYYAKFNIENRYINFASNLGLQGEGKDAFAGKYGAMTLTAYIASIYETIIGSTYARGAGIDPQKAQLDITLRIPAILSTAQSAGMITSDMTAAQSTLALKAAIAGYLMGEAIKSDVGVYAAAANNFMLALATGTATYNTDLTTTYKPTDGQGAGQTVTTAPPVNTVVGYEPPPPPPPPPEPDPAPVAHSFTLTTGDDTFTGESLADTFTATLGTVTTLNANDVLDGGDGDDTLTITSDAGSSFSFNGAKISNIEHVRVTATGNATHLYFNEMVFTDLTNTGSTQDVYFHEVGATTNLKIANTSSATTFETPNTGLSGNADALTLTLSDVTGAAGVTINDGNGAPNQYETLNIVSNGTANSIKLGTDNHQTSLATINISGAAPLTLAFAATSDHVTTNNITIDSHTATGGVTIGSSAVPLGGGANTIILGTGPNVVFFGANQLNTNDTVTATAGTNDTLVISDTAVTSGALTHVTGIETFRFMTSSGAMIQNVAALPNGANLEVDGAATFVQFGNLANNTTVTVLDADQLNFVLAANTGADALTVKIAPGTSAG
ncbi:MAG: hypothetical protein J7528_23020, partial [Caulobacter sp.]|nr:hypothetical protein [Caulobacter sp.]